MQNKYLVDCLKYGVEKDGIYVAPSIFKIIKTIIELRKKESQE
jgi:hypothetical protein